MPASSSSGGSGCGTHSLPASSPPPRAMKRELAFALRSLSEISLPRAAPAPAAPSLPSPTHHRHHLSRGARGPIPPPPPPISSPRPHSPSTPSRQSPPSPSFTRPMDPILPPQMTRQRLMNPMPPRRTWWKPPNHRTLRLQHWR
uniref:Uncharacterized protein n=1 Tax=Arundo donax TaxID=35708 RepID=A0A0A9G8A3_ARUDO